MKGPLMGIAANYLEALLAFHEIEILLDLMGLNGKERKSIK